MNLLDLDLNTFVTSAHTGKCKSFIEILIGTN